MFQALIYPSSGACYYSVELPHWSCCSWFDVCWSFGVVRLLEWLQAEACNTDTSPTNQPHRNSNTHRTKNNTTNVVIQQNSSKLLMMDILMSETCWAHKKWNKIASANKLVFYSSNGIGNFIITVLCYTSVKNNNMAFMWLCGEMRHTTEKTQAFVYDSNSKHRRQHFKNNIFFYRNITHFKNYYIQCHAKFSHVSIRVRSDEARVCHLFGVCCCSVPCSCLDILHNSLY